MSDFGDRGARNTTELHDDGQPPYMMTKSDRLARLVKKMNWPLSYTSNTPKEDLCLEYVEHFRSQYVQLFPSRPPLMLSPDNECGVKKFVCTFARPTELPHAELYDYNTSAKYVAHYIAYEELEDPEKLPMIVASPTTTLAWQAGDSFDMSLLLLSLLIGDGYDAYCVIGYAVEEVTTNTQSGRPTPEVVPDEDADGKGGVKQADRQTKYPVRKRPDLLSKFQLKLEEKKRLEREGANGRDDAQVDTGDKETEQDELYGKRVHCWILVQYGKREVQQSFFIEPSTGEKVEIDSPSYLGIESLFNSHNYWVNMQQTDKISEMSFELRDASKWEYIFLTDIAEDDDDRELQDRKHLENQTSDHGESGDQILDLPTSWVEKLTMTRQQYENRYPGLQKTIQYKDAKVEYFSAYSETDLKVKRMTLLDDFLTPYQVHTFFSFRCDKLRRRSEYNETNNTARIVCEWFDEGRKREQTVLEALSKLITEEGKRMEMQFYWKARLDGLSKRIELFHENGDTTNPHKVMEFFEGREDRLIYRSATYDRHGVSVSINQSGERRGDDKPQPKKMCEKFARNPDVPADQDIAKRTFYNPGTPEGLIRIIYHYADGKITRPSRTYSKGNPVTIEHVDPYAKDPKSAALSEEMRLLFVKEKECMAFIKDSEKEAKEILAQRAKEEQDVGFVTTVYDTLRNKPKEDEQAELRRKQEEQQRSQKKKDYLAPYIEQLVRTHPAKMPAQKLQGPDAKLAKEDAGKVKDACLKDLKDRLIQRAHIMQNRLDEEKEKLARKQSNYQKNQEQIDNANPEEYIQFCENAMWRIHILEKRLERHQEQALHKYAELDQKLRTDPRLSALSG
uniref:Dynein regulatory complex subunit 7 n=1 Tax=Eutreptiella gymnastica TaxID=73025 RepID=A0A7S1I6I9_9EUGL|mmetsp:Transcript_133206/g.231001  ORF Transcript_133206/g.231001 Transcript_133206/m.231001 type:complete len:848 (+) Transcript_133206:174-2717(+)